MKNCEHCRFFEKFAEHEEFGECRFNPPTISVQQADENSIYVKPLHGYWPEVKTSEWCGKWEGLK